MIGLEMRFLFFFVTDCLHNIFKQIHTIITNGIEEIIEKDRVLNTLFLFFICSNHVFFYPNLPRGKYMVEEQLKSK